MNGAMLGEALADLALDNPSAAISRSRSARVRTVRASAYGRAVAKSATKSNVSTGLISTAPVVLAHGVEHDHLPRRTHSGKIRCDFAVKQAEIFSLVLIDFQPVLVGVLEQFVVGKFLEAIVEQGGQPA